MLGWHGPICQWLTFKESGVMICLEPFRAGDSHQRRSVALSMGLTSQDRKEYSQIVDSQRGERSSRRWLVLVR
jgi:hypothetical protein